MLDMQHSSPPHILRNSFEKLRVSVAKRKDFPQIEILIKKYVSLSTYFRIQPINHFMTNEEKQWS